LLLELFYANEAVTHMRRALRYYRFRKTNKDKEEENAKNDTHHP
jgi:hypothetical protein